MGSGAEMSKRQQGETWALGDRGSCGEDAPSRRLWGVAVRETAEPKAILKDGL